MRRRRTDGLADVFGRSVAASGGRSTRRTAPRGCPPPAATTGAPSRGRAPTCDSGNNIDYREVHASCASHYVTSFIELMSIICMDIAAFITAMLTVGVTLESKLRAKAGSRLKVETGTKIEREQRLELKRKLLSEPRVGLRSKPELKLGSGSKGRLKRGLGEENRCKR
ncbi:hypothetical protein EVAR_65269_1 [Eumeta japonica]|uniref:Uncharacterized protein n=1 Tax=Eumeta variegata TaxID=151549 RepID=A0A4C1ZC03_EUMVA|nr:hypothetical protein EVAR_65269_1 [Eumeta japonica]